MEKLTFQTRINIPTAQGEIDFRQSGACGILFDTYRLYVERKRAEQGKPKQSDSRLLIIMMNAYFHRNGWDILLKLCKDAVVWRLQQMKINEGRIRTNTLPVDVSEERILKAIKAKLKKEHPKLNIQYDDDVIRDMIAWCETVATGEPLTE